MDQVCVELMQTAEDKDLALQKAIAKEIICAIWEIVVKSPKGRGIFAIPITNVRERESVVLISSAQEKVFALTIKKKKKSMNFVIQMRPRINSEMEDAPLLLSAKEIEFVEIQLVKVFQIVLTKIKSALLMNDSTLLDLEDAKMILSAKEREFVTSTLSVWEMMDANKSY